MDDEGVPIGGIDIAVKVSEAIPAGEVWLTSGCGWKNERPEVPHGEPEWRVAGMCVHEHLERLLLCSGCKNTLETWQHTRLEPPSPWCAPCYRMRPGGHHCTMTVEFRPLDSDAEMKPRLP